MPAVPPPPAPLTLGRRLEAVARMGLYGLLAANAAAVAVFFVRAGFGANALLLLGRLTGLYAALLMAFQLLLVARLPWLDRRIGMDRLTPWHRRTGFGLLWALLGHAVFITFGYAEMSSVDPVDQLVDLAGTVEGVLRAVVALALILVVGAVSARRARRRLAYETRHFIHLYTYVAVVLAFTHQVAVGSTFAASPAATAYWYGLWGAALAAVFAGLLALTVTAPTLTEADAVATAALALGPEGVAWAAARPGCEVFAVTADRRVARSPGFPAAGAAA